MIEQQVKFFVVVILEDCIRDADTLDEKLALIKLVEDALRDMRAELQPERRKTIKRANQRHLRRVK